VGARLYRVYWRFERRLAPGVRFAQLDYEAALFASVAPGAKWLDLGCGHQLLYPWRQAQERELLSRPSYVVGIDPEFEAVRQHPSSLLRVSGDASRLPFRDGSFDLVTANMVVEHLADPKMQFREIARVLSPTGAFLFHTPNATGYPTLLARAVPDWVRGLGARVLERRAERDRFRTFYRANTPTAIAAIAEEAGLVVDSAELRRTTAMFWFLLPIAVIELLWLRLLSWTRLARWRPNLIVKLRRV
jgi:SAM-dependent methyltransferase